MKVVTAPVVGIEHMTPADLKYFKRFDLPVVVNLESEPVQQQVMVKLFDRHIGYVDRKHADRVLKLLNSSSFIKLIEGDTPSTLVICMYVE
jgi:hypothetical protein